MAGVSASYFQLIAKGAQDENLTINPQISFFKAVYKRHTNFSSALIEVPLQGDSRFGGMSRTTLPRYGDLVSDIYISVALPAISVTGSVPLVNWTPRLGHALIEYVDVLIGQQLIERHDGDFLEIISQLFQSQEKQRAYANMIGDKGSLINGAQSIGPQYLYIPLQFWFCRHNGLTLPIGALQIHDIEIRIKMRGVEQLYQTNASDNRVAIDKLENVSLFVNYIFLDEVERRVFVENDHKYLIEQVQISDTQTIGGPYGGNSINLYFSHPVKELFWFGRRPECEESRFQMNADQYPNYNDWFNFTSSCTPGEGFNFFERFLLQLNGKDLTGSPLEAQYYNIYLPWKYHTCGPDIGLFCYSFALDPQSFQPSGTMNFSRLDSASLRVELNDTVTPPIGMKVFAWGYNVLSISGGQASLDYQC